MIDVVSPDDAVKIKEAVARVNRTIINNINNNKICINFQSIFNGNDTIKNSDIIVNLIELAGWEVTNGITGMVYISKK